MCHRMMTVARIDEILTPLDSGHRDSPRWPSTLGPWTRDRFFCQFGKLGFCSVNECKIFAHRGQLEGDCISFPIEKNTSCKLLFHV